jgi:hypothetical protein
MLIVERLSSAPSLAAPVRPRILTTAADYEQLAEINVGTDTHAACEVMEIFARVSAREGPARTAVALEDVSTAEFVGACVLSMTENPDLAGAPYVEAIGTALPYHGCVLADELTMLSSAQLHAGLEVVALHTPAGPILPVSARVRRENRSSHRMFTAGGFDRDGRIIRVRESKRLSRLDPPAYLGLEGV